MLLLRQNLAGRRFAARFAGCSLVRHSVLLKGHLHVQLTRRHIARHAARRCCCATASRRPRIRAGLPALRLRQAGDHAHGRLPVLLRMQQLRVSAAPQAWRLLCVLLLRLGEVPAGSTTWGLLQPRLKHRAIAPCGPRRGRESTDFLRRPLLAWSSAESSLQGRIFSPARSSSLLRAQFVPTH